MENQLSQQPLYPVASSSSLGKMVIIGLGVLGLGFAVAFGGFYLKNTLPNQAPPAKIVTSSISTNPNTPNIAQLTHYTNTAYGYNLYYPKDLQLQGQGLQVTNTTAPDVLITSDVTKTSPNPDRVLLIKAQNLNLLTQQNKPLSSYTLADLAAADLAANVQNKNSYITTLNPLQKLQPLPGIPQAYTFTIRSKGYETLTGGALWDQGDYVITEFNTAKYRYVLVYSNTKEMKEVVGNFQLNK